MEHGVTPPEHPLVVDLDSAMPIYAQIGDQVARLVDSGAWKPGHQAPSVRALAIRLRVNPMTVQKAYGTLKGQGYLVSRPGSGLFVVGPQMKNPKETFGSELRDLLLRGRQLGFSKAELKTAVAKELQRPIV